MNHICLADKAYLFGMNCRNGSRRSAKGHELHLISRALSVNKDNRSDISGFQAFFGKISR